MPYSHAKQPHSGSLVSADTFPGKLCPGYALVAPFPGSAGISALTSCEAATRYPLGPSFLSASARKRRRNDEIYGFRHCCSITFGGLADTGRYRVDRKLYSTGAANQAPVQPDLNSLERL